MFCNILYFVPNCKKKCTTNVTCVLKSSQSLPSVPSSNVTKQKQKKTEKKEKKTQQIAQICGQIKWPGILKVSLNLGYVTVFADVLLPHRPTGTHFWAPYGEYRRTANHISSSHSFFKIHRTNSTRNMVLCNFCLYLLSSCSRFFLSFFAHVGISCCFS